MDESRPALTPSDQELLNDAEFVIPSFTWRLITTEAFGHVEVGNIGVSNGFAMLSETDFWLNQKVGPLSNLGEPVLTIDQRQLLTSAIALVHQNRLHSVDLVMQELFL